MRISFVAAVTAGTLALAAPAALAYTADPPVNANPQSNPFVDPCPQEPGTADAPNFEGTEVEPMVQVNPTNEDNVIGVFQQDRWYDGGAHGLGAAVSMDGGESYADVFVPFSSCSGSPTEEFARVTDPWVSFDRNGRAYQVALPVDGGDLTGGAVTTSYSDEGGRAGTWSDPVDLQRVHDPTGILFVDKESITADPYHAGRAWVTWIQGNLPGENISFNKLVHAFSYRGTPMIARTTDGGDHWSKPAAMQNNNYYAQGNQIAVEPNGDLVDVQAVLFKGAGIQKNNNGVYVAVMRSHDDGKTWSAPSKVAPLHSAASQADGHDLRVGDYLPDLEVDPRDGNLYVTWADTMGGATNKIVLSRSTDGGQHWSAPVKVSTHDSVDSFNHAVAVAHDGEVAVIYYDTAANDNTTTADGIPTDVYLRHSSDAGKTWSDPQPLYTFNFANAPATERGYFVGDYQGLTAIGDHDLLAFFGVAGGGANTANVESIRLRG